MPLNVNEKPVATELIEHRPPKGVLLADGEYDSNALYDKVAERGGHLLTPVFRNAGKGHRRQSPSRIAVAEAWKTGAAAFVYQDRFLVEGVFGNQSSFGGGLQPLPAWVRTLPRARRWVGAKLIIYHARMQCRRSVS